MTHIESFEPRRLFAARGVDTAFAGGNVLLRSGTVEARPIPAGRNVFVDAYGGQDTKRTIYKYDARGHLDDAWGRHGRAEALPIGTRVGSQTVAYDGRTGMLYVAGYAEQSLATDAELKTLYVQRFNARGRVDASFGHNGTLAYIARAASDVLVARLTPLAHGKLLVAIGRSTPRPERTYHGYHVHVSDDALELLRLNRSGNPDATFGRHGVALVSSGVIDARTRSSDYTSITAADTPTFADLQTLPDGSVRVVSRRLNYTLSDFGHYTESDNYAIDWRGDVKVESVIVDAAGVRQPGSYSTFTLAHRKLKDAFYDPGYGNPQGGLAGFGLIGGLYQIHQAYAEGDDGILVLGGEDGFDETVTHVRPGHLSDPVPLGAPGGIDEISRGGGYVGGYVFVRSVNYDGDGPWPTLLTRFHADGTLDRTWGKHGVLQLTSEVSEDLIDAAVADDSGRVLLAQKLVDEKEVRVYRLNGQL